MGPLFLRIIFYAITGVLLSFITWGTLSHSAVTGDYALSFILLAMMFYVAGQFCVDRWRPEAGPRDFHPTKLWKVPQTTTSTGLWKRVGFNTLGNLAIYAVLSSLLVLTTTAQSAFMVLLGSLFLLRIPYLYWSMRGHYEEVAVEGKASCSKGVLQYRGGSWVDRRARWLLPLGMVAVGASLATAGALMN